MPERRAAAVAWQNPDADLAALVLPIGPPPPRRQEAQRPALADALQPPLFPEALRATRTRSLILLVEDSRMQRELVSEWLTPRYEVITAVDGFEALAKIVSHKPDLVILDLIMPRVSGYELLCALRRAHVDVTVLVASSRIQTAGDRLGPLVLGATDFLQKPVNRLELEHKVETLLRLRRDDDPRFDGTGSRALFGCVSVSRLLEAPDFAIASRASSFGERRLRLVARASRRADARSLDRFLETPTRNCASRTRSCACRSSARCAARHRSSDATKVIERLLARNEAEVAASRLHRRDDDGNPEQGIRTAIN
jgi:DNA-binding response OmpR family regulator